jgi:hypothetical protein
MENLDNYEEITINEKRKIEDKLYYLQGLQNFRIEFHNFLGFLNIILPKIKKHYRFFYRGGIKEDLFLFQQTQSFILYFEGIRDISEFTVNPINYKSFYITNDDLF